MTTSDRRQGAQLRAARNQQLFRELNNAISRLRYSSAFNEYVCECGLKTCLAVISLTVAEYEAIRREPGVFIVLPGHWSKRHERVVREGKGFEIVERIDGVVVPPRRVPPPILEYEREASQSPAAGQDAAFGRKS